MSIYSKDSYINASISGKSFDFLGEWSPDRQYYNNSYVQHFVVYKGVLYACMKSTIKGLNPEADFNSGERYWKKIAEGIKGEIGPKGTPGTTYYPSIKDGKLSWSTNNDGTCEKTINIKGEKGSPGKDLEFKWDNSKLMVRRVGDKDWSEKDLGCKKIYKPSIENGKLIFSLESVSDDIVLDLGNIKGKDGIPGKPGINGRDGRNGKNGKDGKDGKPGKDGAPGHDGKDGVDGKDGKNGRNGLDGKNGLSAYQMACKKGFVGSENDWISSLQGKDGKNIILRVDSDSALFPDENYCGTHIQWKYDDENYTEWRNLLQINQLMNLALGGINLEYNGIVYHEGLKCQHLVLNYYEIDYIDTLGKIHFGNKIRKVSDVYVPVVRSTWEDYEETPDVSYYVLQVICTNPLTGSTVKLNDTITNEITVPAGTEVSIEVSAPCYETKKETIIVDKDNYKEIELNKE